MGEHTKEQFCWLLLIFTWLHWTLAAAHRIFDLSCGLWNPVPQPGMIGPLHWACLPGSEEVSAQCIQDRSKHSQRRNVDVLTSEGSSREQFGSLTLGPCCSSGPCHLISLPFSDLTQGPSSCALPSFSGGWILTQGSLGG